MAFLKFIKLPVLWPQFAEVGGYDAVLADVRGEASPVGIQGFEEDYFVLNIECIEAWNESEYQCSGRSITNLKTNSGQYFIDMPFEQFSKLPCLDAQMIQTSEDSDI